MAPPDNQFRSIVAYILFVVLRFLCSRDHLAILVIQQETALVIEPCELPHIERTDCRTGFHTGCIARSSRSHETITVMIGVVTLQRQDLSGIMAQVHAGRPSKVFCTNNVATDFELPAFTFHTTDILHLAALRIRWLRDLHTEQKVIHLTPIVVELAIQASFKERVIDTQVPLLLFFPSQIRIDILRFTV